MGAWKDCPNLVSIFRDVVLFMHALCSSFHSQFVAFERYREDEFQDDHAAPYQVLLDTGGFIYSPSKSCIISIDLPVFGKFISVLFDSWSLAMLSG